LLRSLVLGSDFSVGPPFFFFPLYINLTGASSEDLHVILVAPPATPFGLCVSPAGLALFTSSFSFAFFSGQSIVTLPLRSPTLRSVRLGNPFFLASRFLGTPPLVAALPTWPDQAPRSISFAVRRPPCSRVSRHPLAYDPFRKTVHVSLTAGLPCLASLLSFFFHSLFRIPSGF